METHLWNDAARRSQVFTPERLYSNLVHAELEQAQLVPTELPPPPPPPVYPAGDVPIVFTARLGFSPARDGFSLVREPRQLYIAALADALGIGRDAVVIRYLSSVWSSSDTADKQHIVELVLETTCLFPSIQQAQRAMSQLQDDSSSVTEVCPVTAPKISIIIVTVLHAASLF